MRQGKIILEEDLKFQTGATISEFSTSLNNNDTSLPTGKAVKEYADSLTLGLDWQESVLDRIDLTTAEPVSPSTGDRYINTVTGTSSQTAQSVTINRIYEWNGSSWTEATPNEGFATWVEDEDVLYTYNGTSWVKFGSTVTHENLNGLQGGTTSQYYHLTSAEHSELTNWLDNVTLGSAGSLQLPNGTSITEFSIDGTLAGNSDDAVPTEKAVKTYVDSNAGGGSSIMGGSFKANMSNIIGNLYCGIFGGGTITSQYADTPMPIAGTIRKLRVYARPTSGGSWANTFWFYVRKNGSTTALNISVNGSTYSASDLSDSISFSVGDTIGIEAYHNSSEQEVICNWLVEFEPA